MAGMSGWERVSDEVRAARHCLPGCDRLDGHDGRDPGACMANGLGPLRETGILIYDMDLPTWPDDTVTWTPMRDRIPRASKCYTLPSGNRVHVKPGCRC